MARPGSGLLSLAALAEDIQNPRQHRHRGNHEVIVRGTFANMRLKNRLAPDTEGPYTVHLPDGEQMTR